MQQSRALAAAPDNKEENTMNSPIKISALVACAFGAACVVGISNAQQAAKQAPSKMSFFVTSVGPGKGADLGGLAGADKHCQSLAAAAGAGNRTWHAYLSTTALNGGKEVNARDRIGRGPWHNTKGDLIAKGVDDLHFDSKINKETGLNEKGGRVNVRGDTPNMHDILTGSDSFGFAFEGKSDTTCGNWTSSAATGSAQVGHLDRQGLTDHAAAKSWVHSHPSRGCSQDALRSSGGGGLFYCFAAK
jgi:hypothetical protein